MHPSARAAVRSCTMLIGILLGGLLVIAPAARAEAAYRYWTYWSVVEGAWRFSTLGPASAVPADGSVEGWRFAVTTAAGSAADAPESDPANAFETICGGSAPVAGKKRVAIEVDFGTPEDAPPGERSPLDIRECITADVAATGYELLRSMTNVRVEDGLVCGIADYPIEECADLAETSQAATQPAPSALGEVPDSTVAVPATSSTAAPLISAVALLAAAIIGGLAWRRRGPG